MGRPGPSQGPNHNQATEIGKAGWAAIGAGCLLVLAMLCATALGVVWIAFG